MHTAVMLCGHGSRDGEAIAELEQAAAGLRMLRPGLELATGYLEFARPTIRDGLEALRSRGARRILAVPAMLFAASHVKNDLPWEINSFAAANPAVVLRFGRELAIEPKLLARRCRPHRRGGARRPPRHPPQRDAAARRRARHHRPRRQFQHRQADAAALGGDGLRLGRDGLQRRRLAAGRAGAPPGAAPGLPAHRRLPLFPLHRHPGEAHLRRRRPGRRRASRDRDPEGALSQRPSRWCSTASSTASPSWSTASPA